MKKMNESVLRSVDAGGAVLFVYPVVRPVVLSGVVPAVLAGHIFRESVENIQSAVKTASAISAGITGAAGAALGVLMSNVDVTALYPYGLDVKAFGESFFIDTREYLRYFFN